MTRDDLPQPDPQQAFDVARQVRRLRALQPRQMGSLLLDTFNEWSADNAGHLGAALAYYALFSITPILVVVMGMGMTLYVIVTVIVAARFCLRWGMTRWGDATRWVIPETYGSPAGLLKSFKALAR